MWFFSAHCSLRCVFSCQMLLAVLFSGVLLVLVGADERHGGRFGVCSERVSGSNSCCDIKLISVLQIFLWLPFKKRKVLLLLVKKAVSLHCRQQRFYFLLTRLGQTSVGENIFMLWCLQEVLCPDGNRCCPEGHLCSTDGRSCIKTGEILFYRQPISKKQSNKLCPTICPPPELQVSCSINLSSSNKASLQQDAAHLWCVFKLNTWMFPLEFWARSVFLLHKFTGNLFFQLLSAAVT